MCRTDWAQFRNSPTSNSLMELKGNTWSAALGDGATPTKRGNGPRLLTRARGDFRCAVTTSPGTSRRCCRTTGTQCHLLTELGRTGPLSLSELGTRACLEYFYPRMIPGGVMISHDYGLLAGVEQAFHEFFADKPEEIIDQPTTQCMIIKL